MSASSTQSRQTIDRFIAGLHKSAESHEPDKGTSHPVGSADTSTQPASEGSRSAENEKDVKNDQGSPAVDNKPEATASSGNSAASDQLQIGTKKAPTGEDPSSETSSVNSSLKDPGTSHPARVDNDELDGKKYASMSTEMLAKTAADIANQILASPELEQLMAAAQGTPTKTAAEAQAQSTATKEAGQVGWDLAGMVSGGLDKQAIDAALQYRMEEIIKTASSDADNVIEYLTAYVQQKQAMAMDAAAGGGMPPEAAMGGMPPEAAMGGMPPGGEGGGEGDDLAMLMQLLEQMGITPEELMAAMAAEQSGGAPMEGAAAPPAGGEGGESGADDSATDKPGMEVEASAKKASAKSKAKPSESSDDSHMKKALASYVKELVARNKK